MSLPTPLGLAGLAAAALSLQSQSPSRPAAPERTASPSAALAWADVDVDGLDDLLAADAAGGVKLLRNAGDGQMLDVTAAYGLSGLVGVVGASWTDADADGLCDLLLVTADGRARLWRHHGAFFADVSASAGLDRVGGVLAAAWVDYDRDGLADLVLEGTLERALLHHLGGFAFEAVELPEPARTGASASAAATREVEREGLDASASDAATREVGRGADARQRDASGRVEAAGGPGGSAGLGADGIDPAPNRGRSGGALPANSCALSMADLSGGPCIPAGSQPQLGALYPLSLDFNLVANGDVGMGTAAPLAPLHVSTVDVGMSSTALANDVGVFEGVRSEVGAYSKDLSSYGSAFVLAEIGPDGGLIDKWGLVRRSGSDGSSLHFTFGANADPSTNVHKLNLSTEGHLGVNTFAGDEVLRVVQGDLDAAAAEISIVDSASKQSVLRASTTGTGSAVYAAATNAGYAVRAYGKGGYYAAANDGAGIYAQSLTGTAVHARGYDGEALFVEKKQGAGVAALMSSVGSLWTLYVTNSGSSDPKAAFFGGDVEAGYSSSFGGLPVVRARMGADTANAGFAEFLDDLGKVRVRIDASHNGDGRITTDELVILGGADLVERFDVREGLVEPGTVLVIDGERPGELRVSSRAYDRAVAGIVSGAGGIQPGLSMGQEGVADGDVPVAMTGRVYVRASAENGAIRPGDRLTSATTAGHAMRVSEGAECDGAVIGKAMGALEEGTGLVLVLVNLQ